MVKKKFIFILIAIILCTIIIPLFLIFTGNQKQVKPKTEKTNTKTTQTQFEEVDFTLYNDKKTTRWELTALKLLHQEKNNYLKLSPVEISVYDNQNNTVLYKFTAEKGSYNGQKGKLEISGPVVIKLANFKLWTRKLSWQQEEDLIKASSGVKITTPNSGVITGTKLLTDSLFSSLSIYGSKQKQAYFGQEEQNEEN